MKTRVKIKAHPRIPSKKDLRAVEEALGASLPPAYRELLLKSNGGEPESNTVAGRWHGVASVSCFFGIHQQAFRDLMKQWKLHRDRVPPALLPIAADSCGNLICLGIPGPGKGVVYFWDHEVEAEEGEKPTYRNLKRLATTFESFLKALTPFGPDDVKVSPDDVESVWIDPEFLKQLEEKNLIRKSPGKRRNGADSKQDLR
jgi:hypothetical protein